MTELITRPNPDSVAMLVNLSLTGLSPRTSTVYRLRIVEFLRRSRPLTAQSIIDWINDGLETNRNQRLPGIEAANQRLAAIRKLAKTAFVGGLMHQEDWFWIAQIAKRKRKKIEASRWLTQSQVTQLLNDLYILDSTPTDIRNGAIIAILLGCGLRRAEVASIRLGNITRREDRWVIADLMTKGSKVRTIGIPSWSWLFVDRWMRSLGKDKAALLFPRLDHNSLAPLSGQWILEIVRDCGALIDIDDLAPHDLRRTYAQLSLKNGADILMVQAGLGHAELRTTQLYLNSMVDFSLGGQAGDHFPGLVIQKNVPVPVDYVPKG